MAVLGQTNPNHVSVRGYYKKNGTYVKPHYRTAPNSTNRDNFSTRGNVNPYTGKPGWVRPDSKSTSTVYSRPKSYSKEQSTNPEDNQYEQKKVGLHPNGFIYARTKSNGQLWRNPNQSDRIRALSKDSYVKILDYKDEFWKVISEGTIGYVHNVTIEVNEAMIPLKIAEKKPRPAKSHISKQRVTQSEVNHEVVRYATSSSVQPGNCTMDDRKSLIDYRFVVQDSYLINQPSIQGEPILKINFGAKVNVICSKSQWLEVVYQNRTGWIEKRLLRK